MKKILITASCLLTINLTQAQQKQGKVTYERATNMEMRMNINGQEQVIPQNRKENFELHYADSKSLWKAAEQTDDDDPSFNTEGGAQIRMIVAGTNDVLFTDIESGKKVEKRELFDKTFIIDDTINKLKWKMTGETKTILGRQCMKATSTRIQTTTRMTMDDGKMERKDVTDTSVVIAWFTTELPVSFGPGEFQGQLPGLILEMDISNGRQRYSATEITEKADVASIKEPTGKKYYTPEEFKKEREKMMKEMEENMRNSGGSRQIRMN
jgi:GLPGLI family protein